MEVGPFNKNISSLPTSGDTPVPANASTPQLGKHTCTCSPQAMHALVVPFVGGAPQGLTLTDRHVVPTDLTPLVSGADATSSDSRLRLRLPRPRGDPQPFLALLDVVQLDLPVA